MYTSINPSYSVGFIYDKGANDFQKMPDGELGVMAPMFDRDAVMQRYAQGRKLTEPSPTLDIPMEIRQRNDAWVIGNDIMIRRDAEMSKKMINRIADLQQGGYRIRYVNNSDVMPSFASIYAFNIRSKRSVKVVENIKMKDQLTPQEIKTKIEEVAPAALPDTGDSMQELAIQRKQLIPAAVENVQIEEQAEQSPDTIPSAEGGAVISNPNIYAKRRKVTPNLPLPGLQPAYSVTRPPPITPAARIPNAPRAPPRPRLTRSNKKKLNI